MVDESAGHAGALVDWFNRDLFDMSLAIHDIDNDVAERTVSLIDRDPAVAIGRVGENVDRQRFVVGDIVEADFTEAFACESFDSLK